MAALATLRVHGAHASPDAGASKPAVGGAAVRACGLPAPGRGRRAVPPPHPPPRLAPDDSLSTRSVASSASASWVTPKPSCFRARGGGENADGRPAESTARRWLRPPGASTGSAPRAPLAPAFTLRKNSIQAKKVRAGADAVGLGRAAAEDWTAGLRNFEQ